MTDTNTNRTPAGYIATDPNQDSGAIYGVGDTPEAALSDALRDNCDTRRDAFGLVAATERLTFSVKASGGGPGDQDWSVYHGDEPSGSRLPTDPDDVRDHLVADLDAEVLS